MKRDPGKYRYLLLALLVVVLDQWSKWWIEVNLSLHEVRPIFPNLNLTKVTNTGVAFGLLPARGNVWGTVLLTVLGLVALTVVLAFFLRAHRRERWLLGGLSLILGGAIGNLIDRVMAGAVTDFIDFYVGSYHWHTFNVADSAISIGIVFMVIDSFSGRDRHEPEPTPQAADPPPASSVAGSDAADDGET